MRISGIHHLHNTVDDIAADEGYHQKQQCFADGHHRIALRILHSQYKGQYDNTDHIIDDRRTQDRLSHTAFQKAQLPQRLYRDPYGGGGHDASDEKPFKKFIGTRCRKSVYAHIQYCTADQRDQYAGTCDQQRDQTGFF